MKKANPIETTTVATRITRPMETAMLRMLSANAHISISDYLRDLIRKDLERRGVFFDAKGQTEKEADQE